MRVKAWFNTIDSWFVTWFDTKKEAEDFAKRNGFKLTGIAEIEDDNRCLALDIGEGEY